MIGTATGLILGGLAAGGQIGGAKIASNASKKAAGQQVAAVGQAVTDVRGERDRFSNQYAPYLDASQGAVKQLSESILLRGAKANPSSARPMAQPMAPAVLPAATTTIPLAQGVQKAQGGLWAVQAPDGETRMVSPEIGAAAVQRGATRVA